jgi:hypothetical protein
MSVGRDPEFQDAGFETELTVLVKAIVVFKVMSSGEFDEILSAGG